MRYQAELKRIKQLFDIKGKTLYKTEQRFVIFKRKSPFKVMKQKIPKINIQRFIPFFTYPQAIFHTDIVIHQFGFFSLRRIGVLSRLTWHIPPLKEYHNKKLALSKQQLV